MVFGIILILINGVKLYYNKLNIMKKKTLLLIEDEPDQVMMYQTEFELYGFKVFPAENGEKGLALAKKEKLDVILLDILMEGMDGIQVLSELKKNKTTKDIPVIVLTNYAKENLAEKVKKMGARGFIVKSRNTPKEVLSKVESFLKK